MDGWAYMSNIEKKKQKSIKNGSDNAGYVVKAAGGKE